MITDEPLMLSQEIHHLLALWVGKRKLKGIKGQQGTTTRRARENNQVPAKEKVVLSQ